MGKGELSGDAGQQCPTGGHNRVEKGAGHDRHLVGRVLQVEGSRHQERDQDHSGDPAGVYTYSALVRLHDGSLPNSPVGRTSNTMAKMSNPKAVL